MANIDVGGRLHSVATGNVLAGANEIYDDVEQKKQSELNQEFKQGIAEAAEAQINEVEVEVDENVGTPSGTASFANNKLILAFQNILGDEIESMEQTTESTESGGINEFRVTTKKGVTADFRIRNGAKGDTTILGEGVEYTIFNNLGHSTTGAMTQDIVTKELRKRPVAVIAGDSLFYVTDQNGNVIAKLNGPIEIDAEGNVITSNFNSANIPSSEDLQEIQDDIDDIASEVSNKIGSNTDNNSAFSICDPQGNVVLKIGSDGSIKTAAFDSNQSMSTSRSIFPKLNPKKTEFRWLDIGNSHSFCALKYLMRIAVSQGVDLSNVAFCRVSRGGSSFKSWYNGYHDADTSGEGDELTGSMYYAYKDFGELSVKVSGNLYSEPNGTATAVTDRELSSAVTGWWGGDCSILRSLLQDNEWDLITIHQRYLHNTTYDETDGWRDHSDGGYATEFIRILKTLQPQATVGVLFSLLPWSTAGSTLSGVETLHAEYCNTMKKFMADTGIDIILPCDTALENLRNSSLPNRVSELTGNAMTIASRNGFNYDGAHTAWGAVAYTMACVAWEMILAPRYNKSCLGNTYRELQSDDYVHLISGTYRKYLQGSYTDSNNEKVMIDNQTFSGSPQWLHLASEDGETWTDEDTAEATIRVDDNNATLCQMAAILAVNEFWTINNPDNVTI